MTEWSLYPNFSPEEFQCSHTGDIDMRPEALELFQAIRDRVGPLIVTSGYRAPSHPVERAKARHGAHSAGLAADFACHDGALRFKIIKAAIECGASGIGIAKTFIHIDAGHPYAHRPAAWSYG